MTSVNMENWLFIDNMNDVSETRDGYRYTLDHIALYPIGQQIPVFHSGNKFFAIARVTEIHINEYGTTLFFTMSNVDEKEAKAFERILGLLYPDKAHSSYDRPRAFESSAAAMDLGMMDSPSETFRKKGGKRRDGGPRALSDALGDDFGDF